MLWGKSGIQKISEKSIFWDSRCVILIIVHCRISAGISYASEHGMGRMCDMKRLMVPEYYYEYEVKGRPASEIQQKIEQIRERMLQSKQWIERSEFTAGYFETERVNSYIEFLREYLQLARKELELAGGVYVPLEYEKREQIFSRNLKSIHCVQFFLEIPEEGRMERELRFVNSVFAGKLSFRPAGRPNKKTDEPSEQFQIGPYPSGQFLERMGRLHLGEWDPEYRQPVSYGKQAPVRKRKNAKEAYITKPDEFKWKLEISYSCSAPKVCWQGENACPYNFDWLLRLVMHPGSMR